MATSSAASSSPARPALLEATLREVVETLCALDRSPCGPGEREAAEWIARRLRTAGVADVTLEDEPSWGPFPATIAALGALHVLGATLVLARRPVPGVALSALAVAGFADEVQNGPRIARRLLRRQRTTVNVMARIGDADAPRTLLVMSHHDAPQTGAIYDQTWQRRAHELMPWLIGRLRTPPPQWWIGPAGPLLSAWGALSGRRRPAVAGLVVGLAGVAAVRDLLRSPTVAGANDNASGVAALVALAELLHADPVPGLRVLLASCGAEETLQDGARALIARHRHELDPARTVVVNLESIGSPELGLLEAEGPLWMERYVGRELRDELCRIAEEIGVALERGFRARASTDGIIASRAGLPTATLMSVTPWRALAHYHLRSDIPANLDYGTVADAVVLTAALARSTALAPVGPLP